MWLVLLCSVYRQTQMLYLFQSSVVPITTVKSKILYTLISFATEVEAKQIREKAESPDLDVVTPKLDVSKSTIKMFNFFATHFIDFDVEVASIADATKFTPIKFEVVVDLVTDAALSKWSKEQFKTFNSTSFAMKYKGMDIDITSTGVAGVVTTQDISPLAATVTVDEKNRKIRVKYRRPDAKTVDDRTMMKPLENCSKGPSDAVPLTLVFQKPGVGLTAKYKDASNKVQKEKVLFKKAQDFCGNVASLNVFVHWTLDFLPIQHELWTLKPATSPQSKPLQIKALANVNDITTTLLGSQEMLWIDVDLSCAAA